MLPLECDFPQLNIPFLKVATYLKDLSTCEIGVLNLRQNEPKNNMGRKESESL